MAEYSNTSLLSSLKGTVLFATGGLALFIGVFIPIAYLALTSIVESSTNAIAITSVVSLMSVAAFGWWLSNKVSEPLMKAILTAKTLERGSLATLPKDSGSSEVDELLSTLQRISIQIQKVATSIDDVASGNLHNVTRLTSNNERITNSLQKLIAKVSNAYKSEHEYRKLRESLRRVSDSTLGVRRGDFSNGILQTADESKEIVSTINILVNELRDLIKDVRTITTETKTSALAIESKVGVYAQMSESKTKEISWASNSLKQLPEIVQKISNDLQKLSTNSIVSLEQTQNTLQTMQQSAVLVNQLRSQITEGMSRVHKLNEQSQEIQKISNAMDDLANRTNLVALNASIQATSTGNHNHSFLVVAEEVEKLANRANNTSKQVSLLNKSFQVEVADFESSLSSVSRDISGVSRLTYQAVIFLEELEKQTVDITQVHQKLGDYTENQAKSSDEVFSVFLDIITQLQIGSEELANAAKQASLISKSMDILGTTVSGFRIPNQLEGQNTAFENEHITPPTADYQETLGTVS